MPKIVVVGGGVGGVAAAAAAAKLGTQVTLLERMEVLGGFALVAGRLHLDALPAMEELRLMSGYDVTEVVRSCVLHKYVKFPFPKPHGSTVMLYDVNKLDTEIRKHLRGLGVEIRTQARAVNVNMSGRKIDSLVLAKGEKIDGDVFIDATGGFGPEENCRKYGNGCAMCIMRCPAFGGRVSIAARAGVEELMGRKKDGQIGAVNAAYSLLKESLAPRIRQEMEQNSIIVIPLPPELISYARTNSIAPVDNIDSGWAENIVLADIGGYAKRIAGGWTPLEELRKVPGLEYARFGDPYAGTIGNGIRYMAITPRGNALDVPGVDNLFLASEKIGINGINSVIATGAVSGFNAARRAMGLEPVILPSDTLVGEFISHVNGRWSKEGLIDRPRFPYKRTAVKSEVLSEEEKTVIRTRVEKSGLLGVFTRGVVKTK